MERPNAWKNYTDEELIAVESLAKRYRAFIDAGKTERECVREAVAMAKRHGYRDLNEVIAAGEALKAGDKVYSVCMDKAIMLFYIGK